MTEVVLTRTYKSPKALLRELHGSECILGAVMPGSNGRPSQGPYGDHWPADGAGLGRPVAPASGGIGRERQAGRPGELAVSGPVQDQRLLGASGLRISGRPSAGLRRRSVSMAPRGWAHYQRLFIAGKTEKVALVACMRKLLVIINSMVKSGQHWDPQTIMPGLTRRLL